MPDMAAGGHAPSLAVRHDDSLDSAAELSARHLHGSCLLRTGMPLDLIATASFGLEAVVARELRQLGYEDQTVEDGRVTFRGDESAICRANLWLRSADRVLLRLGGFPA